MSDGFDGAVERLTRLIRGEEVEPKELEEGLIGHPLEDWARLEAKRLGVDLALTLPLGLVMVSAMCNGSVRVRTPALDAPVTIQFIGLAESGIGKTTVLRSGRKVSHDALDATEDALSAWVTAQIALGAGGGGPGSWTAQDWAALYRAGLCKGGTLIGSATPEAIRNGLVENGSHQVIWTAESDILDEVGRYSKDGGSVTMLIHGWDGEDITVRRAKDGVFHAPQASLPMALLIQPEAFEDATTASVYLSKGVLHRTLLTASGATLEALAGGVEESYADPLAALSGPLEAARVAFGANLVRLARATAPARASRAVMAAWRSQGMALSGLPKPTVIGDRVMRLEDDDALDMFHRVQKVRLHIRQIAAAVDMDNAGSGVSMWEPLCSRLTDHVLRKAGAMRLGYDPDSTVVGAMDLEDALVRLTPWFWEHWAAAIGRRNIAATEEGIRQHLKENPKGYDTTLDGYVIRAFGLLMKSDGIDIDKGPAMPGVPGKAYTKSDIKKKARDLLNKRIKATAYPHLSSALDRMITEGELVEEAVGEGYNGRKRVRLTPAGMMAARPQVK